MATSVNELTFVSRLGDFTSVRADRLRSAGQPVLVVEGAIEESVRDKVSGNVKRCDMRLADAVGNKLANGEMKRPEHPEGRDVRNPKLIADARRKAIAIGLSYYFTCNYAKVVLFSVSVKPGVPDKEEGEYDLAPVTHSNQVDAYRTSICDAWIAFLDDLEPRLRAVAKARPTVTSGDVIALRDAVGIVADEALERAIRRLETDPALIVAARREAAAVFGLSLALNPKMRAAFREEVLQGLKLSVFVMAQKLILYRVLAESGPRRRQPFSLDELTLPASSTSPSAIQVALDQAVQHAKDRSGDYDTAFLRTPLTSLLFVEPDGLDEIGVCRVGEAWDRLRAAVVESSWSAAARNLVGFLYESIVDPGFRHALGQHYTGEDVVDVLATYGIRSPGDTVLDPASGTGSFVEAAYRRKRALGDTHEQSLGDIWATEITAFAAELTTVMLAVADVDEPAAYPRVLLKDFFTCRPGMDTRLQIPGEAQSLRFPTQFSCVIGNPPYISYRHQTNHKNVVAALSKARTTLALPRFSGKSDEYVWFIVHATTFLQDGGRLGFVVSSAMLFSDYGVQLVRFLGRHYRIQAVVDSSVERWFVDADTNTVLLMLERESDPSLRGKNQTRFVRLRRPLVQLLPQMDDPDRRNAVETLVADLLSCAEGESDARFQVNIALQGTDGALRFADVSVAGSSLSLDEED